MLTKTPLLSLTRALLPLRTTTTVPVSHRALTTTPRHLKWDGSKGEDHITNDGDHHNAQHDASKSGRNEKAASVGDGKAESRAAGEGSGGSNSKAKKEFPEAPDTIGMQDERGGKP